MKNNNYAAVFGWMANDLSLKSNELLIFALIHGFSQDGKSKFNGSLSYIASTFKISRNTVITCLKNLEFKKCIVKEKIIKDNVAFNSYSLGSAFFALGSAEIDKGSANFDVLGSAKIAPNNTIIYNTNNIPTAIDFLKSEFPIRFQQDFEMKYQNLFISKEMEVKFYEDFNDEVESAGKDFNQNLFGMLKKYARNWIAYKSKYKQTSGVIALTGPQFKKIG